MFVVEGATLLGTALDAGAAVESVYVDAGVAAGSGPGPTIPALLARAHDHGARVFHLADGVVERVADTVTPQPVLAVVRTPTASLDDLSGATFVVVCVDVRDPGNAGAVIRAADGAGADAVVCCSGTADAFNPKTVRASAGSVMHLPVVRDVEAVEVLSLLGKSGLRLVVAAAHDGTRHTAADLRRPVALVLGNEASGLPSQLEALADDSVTIELGGRAESLNVSLAAAVLCFEVRRQRSNLHAVEDMG